MLKEESRATGSLPAAHRPMKVISINPHTDARWERFVTAHPKGTLYYHPGWLKALEAEYSQPGDHLACEDSNGELQAILPLVRTRGLPFGLGGPLGSRRLSSLPRTPLGGPLSLDPEATAALLRAAVDSVRADPGLTLQIKAEGPELDGMADGLTCTPWRFSYIVKLLRNPEGQFWIKDKGHRDKVKWAVKKAAKLGVRVRLCDDEAELKAWYPLYVDSLRRNGVPARSYRLFASLWKELQPKGLMQFYIAEQVAENGQARMVGGSIFLKLGKTVFYAFTGSWRQDLSLHPYDAILWEAISDACQTGMEFVDFGEVVEGDVELVRFKTKWGAEPVHLHRYYFPALPVEAIAEGESKSSIGELRDAVWRRLPLNVVAWIGDRVYSYL